MKRRFTGSDFRLDRVLEDLRKAFPEAGEPLLERVARDVVLREYRRGKRAGLLEAALRVTDEGVRRDLRLEARGFEPDDVEEDLARQGRGRARARRVPDPPF